ncbi:MAG: restriction endonuclease subunit S [Patescibacteria group bacterium]
MTQTVLLGDIATIQTGPFGSQLHQKDYVTDGTPIITVEHLGQDRIDRNGLPRVTDLDKQRLNRYWLKEGDTVFSRVGSVDRASYVHKEEDGWLFSGRCLRVSPNKEKVNSRFLSFLLRSDHFTNYIKSIAVGATMPSINTKLLATAPVTIPAREQQDFAAEVLDEIERKIELNRGMNETLEQIGQALFKHYFIDNPEAQTWPERRLGEFFPVKTGKKDANFGTLDGEYPFFTCAQTASKAPDYSFEGSALLLAGNGDFSLKLYRGKFEAYQRTYVLIPADERLVGYLYFLMSRFLDEITSGSRGSVIKFITKGMIENYKIIAPSDQHLIQIEEPLNQITMNVEKNKEQMTALAELRDSLLPRLISGKLKV